jgi:hypothetical protein
MIKTESKLICDLCGAEMIESPLDRPGNLCVIRKTTKTVFWVRSEKLDRKEYDLCPNCEKKLTKWIDTMKASNTAEQLLISKV